MVLNQCLNGFVLFRLIAVEVIVVLCFIRVYYKKFEVSDDNRTKRVVRASSRFS